MNCPCECHGRAFAECRVDGVPIEGGCGQVYDHTPVDAIDTAHRCRRHDACPDGVRVPIPGTPATVRAGARIAHADGLCPTCERVVCSAIASLPRDWVRCQTLIGAEKSGWNSGEMVSGSRELKVPIRVYVEALMRDIGDELAFWAAIVEPDAPVLLPRSPRSVEQRPGVVVDRAAAVLERYRPFWGASTAAGWHWQPVWTAEGEPAIGEDGLWLMTAVDALSGALRMLTLHERAQSFAGLTEVVTPKPIPCPRCETLTLVHRNGTDGISCVRCDSRWPLAEYEALVAGLTEGLIAREAS